MVNFIKIVYAMIIFFFLFLVLTPGFSKVFDGVINIKSKVFLKGCIFDDDCKFDVCIPPNVLECYKNKCKCTWKCIEDSDCKSLWCFPPFKYVPKCDGHGCNCV
ncbi:unnamed protein product [Lathyrus oleraceus]|uniref:Late nodulin domain-containing protein n=1 Tax=Pisum sativum TaxID=3888 RepID=A0A9D5BKS1_PEA|nr:hypothetical protein KIW84_013707 [Pisum sativum]